MPSPDAPGSRAPDAPTGGDDVGALEWKKVHRVTPLVRGWAVLAVAIAILGQQSFEVFGPDDGEGGPPSIDLADIWWIAMLALLGIAVLAFGAMWLAWRKTSYAVGEREVHHRQGVVFRQQRHARLDRLQAIDIRQPVLARIFGLAELRLEVAGGADSTVVIGFLRDEEARQLRAEILARAAGIRTGRSQAASAVVLGDAVAAGTGDREAAGDPATAAPTALAEEAPEQELYLVPPGRLAVSLLRSPSLWIAALVGGAIAVATVATGQPGVLFSAIPVLFALGSFLFGRFAGEFNFRAAMSPDGIRVRRGLLETRAQTVPPGRVQAISLIQGPLWRGCDWWRVKVNVAGYQQSETQAAQSVLLPVGTRSEALTALWLVLPDLGTDDPLALLDEGLTGIVPRDGSPATAPDGGTAAFTNAPRRAWPVDPLGWRRDAFAVTSRALLIRRGRLVRRLDVVPHERMQSVAVEQGPLQRRLRVATFAVHSTPGAIAPEVPHIDEADARRLLGEQAGRARAARQVAGPERWMEALAQGEPAVVPAALAGPEDHYDAGPEDRYDTGPEDPDGAGGGSAAAS